MTNIIRVAIIGLDTSHSVEFPRRMQAPDCAREMHVQGLRAVSVLRFPSPFQSEQGQDQRQAQLESWGVRVAADLEDALRDADAIMVEINDPSLHRLWFERVAPLAAGRPVFVDKPLADTQVAGTAIAELAGKHGVRIGSCSPLRSAASLVAACAAIPCPAQAHVYGPLGRAPAGSSIVWYGVHAAEMLQRAMGSGAIAVTARRDGRGVVALVDYPDRRRGVIELTEDSWIYGGTLRGKEAAQAFRVESGGIYTELLVEVARFFAGGEPPATIEQAQEVLALLDATERSLNSSRTEPIYR